MTKGMSRALMGYIVDEVFDGAIEDTKVIEDIYAAIKRHETLSASPAGVKPLEAEEYRKVMDAAIAAYEANTPPTYRYSATALCKAVEAAFAARIMSAIEPAGVGVGTVPPIKFGLGGTVTLREAARSLLDARQNGLAHIGYRLDLWRDIEAAVTVTEGETNGQ